MNNRSSLSKVAVHSDDFAFEVQLILFLNKSMHVVVSFVPLGQRLIRDIFWVSLENGGNQHLDFFERQQRNTLESCISFW